MKSRHEACRGGACIILIKNLTLICRKDYLLHKSIQKVYVLSDAKYTQFLLLPLMCHNWGKIILGKSAIFQVESQKIMEAAFAEEALRMPFMIAPRKKVRPENQDRLRWEHLPTVPLRLVSE